MEQSQANFLTLGTGIFNYQVVNAMRLPAFHAGDIRLDKKWNYKHVTLDVFLDITNFYGAKNTGVANYTFKRTEDNKAFVTTDGLPIQANGKNAIPVLLENIDQTVLPTIGFIVEF